MIIILIWPFPKGRAFCSYCTGLKHIGRYPLQSLTETLALKLIIEYPSVESCSTADIQHYTTYRFKSPKSEILGIKVVSEYKLNLSYNTTSIPKFWAALISDSRSSPTTNTSEIA